jgi:Protein of unknown function (DUF2949)
MHPKIEPQLLEFLQRELSVSTEEIGLVMRRQETAAAHLPILLWQHGLITIQQLEIIFDWQDRVSTNQV